MICTPLISVCGFRPDPPLPYIAESGPGAGSPDEGCLQFSRQESSVSQNKALPPHDDTAFSGEGRPARLQ